MKIDTTPREDHQITLTVEADLEQLEAARHRAARKIAQQAKIPGFRPGKAPYDIVRRLYGEKAIDEEATELLVNDIYPLAIKEANIEPAAMGQLEKIESLDPPKFIFIIPLAPKVDLGDYRSVRLPYEWTAPTDEQIEDAIANLRRMYSATESVERAAAEGDYVMVDVSGVKAKPKEGEDNAPLLERSGFAMRIHTDEKEDEWPFPGFAAKLAGVKPEEETSFTHKFPKDHPDEALQGQNFKITVKVKTVRGINLPDLDDTFAAKTGMGLTVDDLRAHMRENLARESRNAYDDNYFEEALEKFKAIATIKYPPQVLEHEVERTLIDIESRLKSQGIENMDAYYKIIETTPEKFLEEQAKPLAQRHIERSLILDEIARVEKLTFEEQALDQEFRRAWSSLVMNDPEFNKRTKGGTKPTREMVDAVAMESAHRLMAGLALGKIKAIANGEIPAEGEVPEGGEGPAAVADEAAVVDEEKPEAEKAAEAEAPAATEGEAKPAKKKAPARKKSE